MPGLVEVLTIPQDDLEYTKFSDPSGRGPVQFVDDEKHIQLAAYAKRNQGRFRQVTDPREYLYIPTSYETWVSAEGTPSLIVERLGTTMHQDIPLYPDDLIAVGVARAATDTVPAHFETRFLVRRRELRAQDVFDWPPLTPHAIESPVSSRQPVGIPVRRLAIPAGR